MFCVSLLVIFSIFFNPLMIVCKSKMTSGTFKKVNYQKIRTRKESSPGVFQILQLAISGWHKPLLNPKQRYHVLRFALSKLGGKREERLLSGIWVSEQVSIRSEYELHSFYFQSWNLPHFEWQICPEGIRSYSWRRQHWKEECVSFAQSGWVPSNAR